MSKIKKLFGSPWKATVSSICTVLLLAGIFTGTAYAASAIAENNAIGNEKAQNFAFADAGVDPATAKVVKTEFDFEQGQFVYEVEFYANDTEYKYWVKADNGAIIKKELEINNPTGGNTALNAEITLEDAKKIALTDAGVSSEDVVFTEGKLDKDQSLTVYDISFYTKDTEYEYEINASTGAVFSKSKETQIINNVSGNEQALTSEPTSDKQSNTNTSSTTNVNSEQQTAQKTTGTQAQSSVTLESAQNTALSDAGVKASDATFTKSALDYDDGRKVYDIEFYTASYEYEYEIDANTGEVFSKNKETLPVKSTKPATSGQTTTSQPESNSQGNTSNTTQNNNQGQTPNPTKTPVQSDITLESAKNTALSDAGVNASDATFTKSVADYDDGHKVYDIEFYTSTHEYDYEINAETGKIIKRDVEAFRVNQGNTSNSANTENYIGVEQAKSIAVSHAGLSVDSVTFQKAKVEKDDGFTVYEVEFFSNGIEYEYTIDAVSGNIMEYDSDRD